MQRHKISPLAWFIMMFSIAIAAMFLSRSTNYYPQLTMEVPGPISMDFLLRAHEDVRSCETTLARLSTAVLGACPTCRVKTKQCVTNLSAVQQRVLSNQPISLPSAHLPDGVVTYSASNTATALVACEESQRHSTGMGIKCFAPDIERPFFTPKKGWVDPESIGYAFLVLIFAQLVAKLVCYLIVRYEHVHAHLSHDSTDAGPQKFHALPTPRIGGLALIIGLLVSSAVLSALPQHFPDREFGLLILAAMPAFLGGLTEDITKKVGVLQRLVLTMLSAGFGAWLLGASLSRVDVPGLDHLMQWAPFAITFTIFAVAGATNAINIIDGYNGLAAGFGAIVSIALAFVSAQVGDSFLLTANLAMVGALLGFLVWNWPSGKIFLGDGGAYLLGFWLSEMSVLLLTRHPEVSVWFPMLLMIYPVFETLFSVYRRKIKRNEHPGHPDAMHLHQLIFCRLIRLNVGTTNPILKTKRNSMVCLYLWIFSGIFSLVAILAWRQHSVLIVSTLLFCILYTVLYRSIATWRVPAILRIKRGSAHASIR
ncbi:MAG: glycosyl transferase [Rhodocyclaceae bacterium]|nr:glycosyl transferase [Rhodocyclaceae bacterium]